MSKLVSIIVPVHNAGRFIEKTIESVLSQSYQNFELLLVNDGSTDNSVSVIKNIMASKADARINLLVNPRSGSAARTRNLGIKKAKGDYIAFLDADDIWHKDKLEKTVNFLEKQKSVFVFTGYEFADEHGRGLGKYVNVPACLDYENALSRTVIFTSTVMFDISKESMLSKEDIMMPEIKSEDTATWWRILRKGIIANGLNESLVLYRRAGKSLSSNKIEAIKRIWFLYRKSEKLSIIKSIRCFIGWAFGATMRRL